MSIASVYFLILIVLFFVFILLSLFGKDESALTEISPILSGFVFIILLFSVLIRLMWVSSFINLEAGPIASLSMEQTLLQRVASNRLQTLDGYLRTGVGTFYFLGNNEVGKAGTVETYYAYQKDGAAHLVKYVNPNNSKPYMDGTGLLASQCILDHYKPACNRMVEDFTYTPGIIPLFLENKPSLVIYKGKTIPLASVTTADLATK